MLTSTVSDTTGNRQDKIANAAKVLERSETLRKIFSIIYSKQTPTKSVSKIMDLSKINNRVKVLKSCNKLVRENMIYQMPERVNGETVYKKEGFYQLHRDKILKLARNKNKLNSFPTKYNPKQNSKTIFVKYDKKIVKAIQLTVDDINTFRLIKKVKRSEINVKVILENTIKEGFINILNEEYEKKDWGGETDDLFSTRINYKNKRQTVAFAFKGRGTQGLLTPNRMGKNGDQIQRLFRCPANFFILQYHSAIDENVFEQMKMFATAKSVYEAQPIFYCIIDGLDTARVIEAYLSKFKL